MYECLMVNMSGASLRRVKIKTKLIGEAAVDAGGILSEVVTLVGLEFAKSETLFETFDHKGGICISNEAVAIGLPLVPIFRFFGRFIMLCWLQNEKMPMLLSEPLLKLIKGQKVSAIDVAGEDIGIYKQLKYYLDLPEDEWEYEADNWEKEIQKYDKPRTPRTLYLPEGHGKCNFFAVK